MNGFVLRQGSQMAEVEFVVRALRMDGSQPPYTAVAVGNRVAYVCRSGGEIVRCYLDAKEAHTISGK